jgi:methyl-accepting chemotaxis protein
MSILNNFKIGHRLGVAFSFLILFMVVQSILTWINFNVMQKDFDLVVQDRFMKVQLATQLGDSIADHAQSLESLMLSDDVAHTDLEQKKMVDAMRLAQTCIQKMEATINTPVGKAALTKVIQAQAQYLNQQDRFLSLLKQDKRDEAKLNLIQSVLPAKSALVNANEALIESQTHDIHEFAQEAQTQAQSGKVWLLTLSIATIVLTLLIGILITRSVTRPLEQLRRTMDEVQLRSNFALRAPVMGHDEIALTSSFFNNLMGSLQHVILTVNQSASAMARGDFGHTVDIPLEGDLDTMKQAINVSALSVEVTINALSEVMLALKQGDFSKRMSKEVQGDVRETIDGAMQSMELLINEVGLVMSSLAQGDLSGRVHTECDGQLAVLKHNINLSLNELSKVLRDVMANTQQVATATSQTAAAISQISDGAQTQTMAIAQVDLAIKETAASVLDVSQSTESASSQSKDSVLVVKRSKAQVLAMLEVVNMIASNSEKINKITEIIENIANKTNLLSLNAAIEAARAGEHGRGFSVVAQEVGNLAANSGESAQEINALVSQAVTQARAAVETAKKVSAEMDLAEQCSVSTDGLLTRIASAIEQQSSAIHEIESNCSSLTHIAQSNASASEQITASVMELSKIAERTRKLLETFQL